MRSGIIGALAVVVLASAPTAAQDFGGVWDVNVVSQGQALSDSLRIDSAKRTGRASSSRQLKFSAIPRQPVDADGRTASLRYAATAALKRDAMAGFLARVGANDPQQAAAVEEAFAGHDYDGIYAGVVRPFGLGANDAADSLTAYMILGWMIANGAGDPPRESVLAARSQVASMLLTDDRLSSPDVRAQLGEEFKILFVALHAGWQSARREGVLPAYADGVARMFRAQGGVDLRDLALRDGFVRRG